MSFAATCRFSKVGRGISGHPSALPNSIDALFNEELPTVGYFYYCASTPIQTKLTRTGCLFLRVTNHFSMLIENPKFALPGAFPVTG